MEQTTIIQQLAWEGGATTEIHPLADVFPRASQEDQKAIENSIKRIGFRTDRPIILLEGQILDGVNRYNAALKLGVQPLYKNYDSPLDPREFVLAENRDRRHLTSSQKAAIAIDIGLYDEEVKKAKQRSQQGKVKGGKSNGSDQLEPVTGSSSGGKKKASNEAASRVGGTSGAQIERAAWLRENAPEELEAVRRGEVSAPQAVDATKARLKYPEGKLGRYPRKEQVKMAKTLDKLPEDKRREKVDLLASGDGDTLAFLTGRPPVPDGPTPKQKAKADPGVRFVKFMADLYEQICAIEDGGGLQLLSRDWSTKTKKGYHKEVRELRLALSSWEEYLEMEVEKDA